MKHRSMRNAAIGMILTLGIVSRCSEGLAQSGVGNALAKAVEEVSGRGSGLCVHLGCGDGRLTAGLARDGKLLVHGLDADPANVEKARKSIQSQKLYGQASVELLKGKTLPYADDLVNVTVVEDWAAVSKAGVSVSEVMRVICPKGMLLVKGISAAELKRHSDSVRNVGGWTQVIKPRPESMDDWSHRYHDAGRSNVSQDDTDPAGNVRWLAGPPHPNWGVFGMGNTTYRGTVRGMVSGDGRYFCLTMSSPRNLNRIRKEVVLNARDAHNGLLLWDRSVTDYLVDLGVDKPLQKKEIDFREQLKHHGTHAGSPYNVGRYWRYDRGRSKEKLSAGEVKKAEELKKVWGENTRKSNIATAFGHTLVAKNNRVYGVIGGCAVSIDATTGRLLKVYEKDGSPTCLFVEGQTVVVAGGGSVRVYDSETGKQLWKQDGASVGAMALGEKKGFFLLGGRGSSSRFLCLDLATGRKAWDLDLKSLKHVDEGKEIEGKKWPRKGRAGFRDQLFYKDGCVVLICGFLGKILYGKGLHVISPEDGRELWSKHFDASGGHYSSISVSHGGGLIWFTYSPSGAKKGTRITAGFDPQTGELKKKLDGGLNNGMCGYGTTMIIATEKYFVNTRPIKFMSREDGKVYRPIGARGVCTAGAILANGLTYFAPQGCDCVDGSLRCFGGIAARKPLPAESKQKNRLEKGSAYGKVSKPATEGTKNGSAWSTHRHDNQRSAATTAEVDAAVKLLWDASVEEQTVTNPRLAADGRLSNWVLTDPLTAPVVAAGKVYVGAINSHQVFALDAKAGRKLWSFTAGGRVDLSPTIYKGLCLFGSRDGHAYCLRADTGELVWRFQAAPQDYLIMAYGQLESPSPIVGGVTVQNDVAYFGAGRTGSVDSSYTWYAVDPWTGKVLRTKNGGPRFTWPDMLISDGSKVLPPNAGNVEVTAKGGGPGKLPYVTVPGGGNIFAAGIVDRFWRFPGMCRDNTARRTGGAQIYRGCLGRITVGGPKPDDVVFLFGRFTGGAGGRQTRIYKEYCAFPAQDGVKRPKGDESKPLWSHQLDEPLQIEALIMTKDVLFAAGPADRFQRKEGFLWALSPEDGKKLNEIKLPTPPTGEGLAATEGRLFVSLQNGNVMCFGK